jgi:hypothetical protein
MSRLSSKAKQMLTVDGVAHEEEEEEEEEFT